MTRFALIALSLGFVGLIGAASLSSTEAMADKPCFRTTFQTELIKKACTTGQAAAKDAMKNFLKTAKKTEASLECKSCHEKLAPQYPLKTDAVDHFHHLGGK